jgi:hypothetical protein
VVWRCYLCCCEAWSVVDGHLEDTAGVFDAHHRWPAQVAVRIVAVPESKAVDASVGFVVCGAVVEEASDGTALKRVSCCKLHLDGVAYPPAVGVNHKREAIELTNGVNAGRADLGLAVFRVPELEITAASLLASGSELEFCRPFGLRYTVSCWFRSNFKGQRTYGVCDQA